MMNGADIILLSIIVAFGLAGFFFGFIHTLGSLLGTVFGVYLASRYYGVMAGWLMNITGWQGNITKVVMFVVAFFLITRLVGIAFFFIEKFFNILKFLPFVKTFDRFIGLGLGIAEGIITIGFTIFFIERFPLSTGVMTHLATSVIAPYASGIASGLWPLLPEAFRLLQSSVDYVEKIVK
jgi:uncharacterized membrane protein required for colicin V production